eukprot:365857-Chlamydomonas_euryale.AAC.9
MENKGDANATEQHTGTCQWQRERSLTSSIALRSASLTLTCSKQRYGTSCSVRRSSSVRKGSENSLAESARGWFGQPDRPNLLNFALCCFGQKRFGLRIICADAVRLRPIAARKQAFQNHFISQRLVCKVGITTVARQRPQREGFASP